MPGIFDVLAANGILNSLFGGQQQSQPDPRAQAEANQQTFMDILAGRAPVPRRSNDATLMANATPPALVPPRAGQDAVADMEASSAATPTPMIIQAMENGGVPVAPRTTTQDVVNDMDASSQPMNVSALAANAPQAARSFADTLGLKFDRPLARLAMGLGAAGSQDPLATLARMRANEEELAKSQQDRTKPKFVPIPGSPGGWLVYPDGRQEFIQDAKLAQFLSNSSENRFLRQLLLAREKANLDVDTSNRKAAGKEQAANAGDATSASLAVNELERIAGELEKTDTATGPAVGILPKWARDIATPKGAALQDDAERIIQASLRQTLGAQFTEKEAIRFLERAYNPRLDEAENAKRLRQIAKELADVQNNKEAALEYMRRKGTLEGFKPPPSDLPGRSGGDQAAPREGDDITARVQSAFGAYEPDKYEYRINNGVVQRRIKQ